MIDSRAIIDPTAKIAEDVEIGPFSIIGKNVEIDSGTWIGPHVVINGPTRIGKDNRIFQFSSIGDIPQDKKYAGEDTVLEIGDRNIIREYCTFNRGTVQGGGITRLGNDNWIMAYVHLAHDCQVGNNTIFANGATLAGHVEVEDKVIFGAFTVIHQFCR
ncbi:MAG: acyl-ACP--UDP-N-acetylglucosamine O-acyltransferase, partial [Gammaproteobacteria bacterium]